MEITGAMKSIVECPICLQIPNGKVFLCENSHKICEKCYYKLEDHRCPQGSCKYRLPEPFRNQDLEDLIENCGFEVACNNGGCKVVLKGAEMRTHEEDCPRRLVSCFMDEDCDQVALEDMPDHLRHTHGSKFGLCNGRVVDTPHNYEGETVRADGTGPHFNGEELRDALVHYHHGHINFGEKCLRPVQFSFDGHQFFYNNAMLGDVWFNWLSVNAGKRVAERYKATLSYKKLDSPFRIEATVQVLPVDVYWKEVLKSGHCLPVNAGQVSVLMNDLENVSEDLVATTHALVFDFEIGKIEC